MKVLIICAAAAATLGLAACEDTYDYGPGYYDRGYGYGYHHDRDDYYRQRGYDRDRSYYRDDNGYYHDRGSDYPDR